MIHTLCTDPNKRKNCIETLCKSAIFVLFTSVFNYCCYVIIYMFCYCRYLDNIIQHPGEQKYRKIRTGNKTFLVIVYNYTVVTHTMCAKLNCVWNSCGYKLQVVFPETFLMCMVFFQRRKYRPSQEPISFWKPLASSKLSSHIKVYCLNVYT
jgi:hypothetical protein